MAAIKLKRFAAKIMLVAGGLLFGCLVAEIARRIAGYSYPIFYQTDQYAGYAPIPGVEGWFWVENKTYVRINNHGFRDRDHEIEKPANTLRIAVLGDSFAEARQVDMGSAFWAVMERELSGCSSFAGKDVEVLNFGVGGYGTASELMTLRHRVWQYSPDVVLLAFTTYNDIADNYPPFKGAEEIPYFKFEGDQIVLDDSFKGSKKYRKLSSWWFNAWIALHNSSRFIQLAHHGQFAFRTRMSHMKELKRIEESKKQREDQSESKVPLTSSSATEHFGLENALYVPPDNVDWNEAWRLTEGMVALLKNEVEQQGAKFLMVSVSTDIQAYPDKSVRKARADSLGVPDLRFPNRQLGLISERNGIDFFDLAKPMQIYAAETGTFLHGFNDQMGSGHWNEIGHKLAGELIAKRFCSAAQ